MHLLFIQFFGNFVNKEQEQKRFFMLCGQSVKIQTFRTPIDTGIPMLDSFANILPEKYCHRRFKRSTMTENQNGNFNQGIVFLVFIVVIWTCNPIPNISNSKQNYQIEAGF